MSIQGLPTRQLIREFQHEERLADAGGACEEEVRALEDKPGLDPTGQDRQWFTIGGVERPGRDGQGMRLQEALRLSKEVPQQGRSAEGA